MASTAAAGTPYTPSGRWFFSQDQVTNTPSVRAGLPIAKEISYRQQAANFIQDMGQHLRVTQLCINTAIVYTYRFYMFHSYQRFHRNSIALASLFLAAKVEEQPRKLEHVIKMAHICLNGRDAPHLDTRSESYHEKAQELVMNENILLQTLGFDVAIDHPHTHVVRCCQLVKASKELAQASYYLATNSLHLTTMCLRYSPTIVACFCIHLACKWSNYKIPLSAQNKEWFVYVDPSATNALLEELTEEFLTIYEQCPSRLKKKIKASTQAAREEEEHKQSQTASMIAQHTNGPSIGQLQPNRVTAAESADPHRRVPSQHQNRPPSQPQHPAKLPSGPSFIFDQPVSATRVTAQGDKTAHPGHVHPVSSSGQAKKPEVHNNSSSQRPISAGHGDYKVPQVPASHSQDKMQQQPQQQHHLHNKQLPPQHRQHQSQQPQQAGSISSSSRTSHQPSNHASSHHHATTSSSHPRNSVPSNSSLPGISASIAGRPTVASLQQPPSHRSSSGSARPSGPSPNISSSSKLASVPPLQPPKTPPSLSSLSSKSKSIFDIDSPVKSFIEAPKLVENKNWSAVVDTPFSSSSSSMMSSHNPPSMNVEIKTEPSARPLSLPKISKNPSLFSPPSDNETKPEPQFLQTSNSASFPINDVHSNIVKQEPAAYLNDISSIHVAEPKLEEQNHQVRPDHAEDIKKEKKHKEKKKKKEKHREKDREREEDKEKHDSNGSKKHKHKHKEKSKHRDSDREKSHEEVATLPAIRLKIKTIPPSPLSTQPPTASSLQPVAPIKIKINGETDSSSRKRPREETDVSGNGPATKMSRVLGTSVESESKFLHVVGGSNSSHHLPPKSVKKVSSR